MVAVTERTALSVVSTGYASTALEVGTTVHATAASTVNDDHDNIGVESGTETPSVETTCTALCRRRSGILSPTRAAAAVISGAILLLVMGQSAVLRRRPSSHAAPSESETNGDEDSVLVSSGSRAPLPHGRVIPSMQPFSTTNPRDACAPHMDRPPASWPTSAWGALANASAALHTSLPTNAWWENIVLGSPTQERAANNVVVIPYTLDVAGEIPGVRIHFPHVTATDLIVQANFDWRHALQLGCVEDVSPHYVTQPGPLSVTINWDFSSVGEPDEQAGSTEETSVGDVGPAMSVPAVRGSPYVTMEYRRARPVVSARQEVTRLVIDGEPLAISSDCGDATPVRVEREAEIVFAGGAVSGDDTWLVFVSAPTNFLCSSWFARERGPPPTPGAQGDWLLMPRFRMEAVEPMVFGVVRAAMLNTCTTGVGPGCDDTGIPADRETYARLLRRHAEVYPTGEARVSYSSSSLEWIEDALQGASAQAITIDGRTPPAASATPGSTSEPSPCVVYSNINDSFSSCDAESAASHAGERSDAAPGAGSAAKDDVGTLRFLWAPRRMDGMPVAERASGEDGVPLIMFSLLHHQDAFTDVDGLSEAHVPTLQGKAKVAIGNEWSMDVKLPPVSFGVGRPVRDDMLDDINAALDKDVGFEMPANYLQGAGDTYFSGKMLAKMGRISLIAEEMGRHAEARTVAARLAEAAQVWLNGTAASPMLYDFRWGGIVTCGCAYRAGEGCTNSIGPEECPGLSDPGMNFGLGFYNDHHFHFGYHIFAAAVAAKFLPEWGMKHHEAVMLLIRDIANPSSSDPFFPVFRHKDWYLGSSWALGIPTLGGAPYANGRNQESSSEAVNAYYGVALYGHVMAQVFTTAGDPAKAQSASLIRDTGRQLLATEMKSAQTYWQVVDPGTSGMPRVYPEAYQPHVVGMLWSTLAQMQTWFGAEPWKVYGIQMLPITAASEQLLDPRWVQQMLPSFEESCLHGDDPVKACVADGWSALVHAAQAIAGRWEDGRDGILALPDDAFESSGGDGHSRTSMLWFIANRPSLAYAEDSQRESEAP